MLTFFKIIVFIAMVAACINAARRELRGQYKQAMNSLWAFIFLDLLFSLLT